MNHQENNNTQDIKTYNLHPFRVLKACAFDDDDLNRPIIGIANAFSEVVPGHTNLRQLAEQVKKGVYRAGGNASDQMGGACGYLRIPVL